MRAAFFLVTLFISYFLDHLKKIVKYLPVINILSGSLLVIIGSLLVTNYFSYVSQLLNR